LDGDSANLALALKFAECLKSCARRAPVCVRMESHTGLGLLLLDEKQQKRFGGWILPFGMLEDICNAETLERKQLDCLAAALHDAYCEAQKKTGVQFADNASLVDWQDLPEDLKNSNRYAADHIGIKLRAIGG